MRSINLTIIFLVTLYSANGFANPQHDYGKITGQVVDKSIQMPLPSVNILVEGITLGAASDDQGRFVISHVPVGSHNLRFRMMGYKELVKSNVVVNPGRNNDRTGGTGSDSN